MGAWGTGIFENDSAWDHITALNASEDPLTEIINPLKPENREEEYLEVDEGSEALVNALIILLLEKKSITKYVIPSECLVMIETVVKKSQERWLNQENVVGQLLTKLKDVGNTKISESAELWEDSDYYEEWRAILDTVITDLSNNES